MAKKYWMTFVCAAVVCASLVGCGPKKPADMPETVPFKVSVVDGSTPIADVRILFIHSGNTVITGTTNALGVAEMSTTLQNYTAPGAPLGEYRVTCTKDPMVDHWKTADERAKMDPGEAGAYQKEWEAKCAELPREIPIIWKNFDKTPLKANVTGAGELTFDVEGKANK